MTVTSFGNIPGDYVVTVSSSLGGSKSMVVHVLNANDCPDFCGEGGERSVNGNMSTEQNYLYPNPATNFIQLKLKEGLSEEALRIVSVEGIEVINIRNYSSGEKIDISRLSDGIYFIFSGIVSHPIRFVKID